MLNKLNRALEKALPLLTPASVLLGICLGGAIDEYRWLAPWVFAFMTFSGSLSLNFKQFMNVLSHPLPLVLTFILLHVAMPLLALGVGTAAFPDAPLTVTGLVLLAAIPTGITSFVWVSMLKGNTALTLAIILIDTMLAPFVVPHTVAYLVGAEVAMDPVAMMRGLLGMIVLPSLLGMALHQWTRGRVHAVWSPRLSPFSKLAMAVVVALNSAFIAPHLQRIDAALIGLAAVVLALAAAGYALGWLSSRALRADSETALALTLNSGMRNIGAGAVLAVTYFPAPVAVPVVLGMLFQQSLASLFGYALTRSRRPAPLAAPTAAHTKKRQPDAPVG